MRNLELESIANLIALFTLSMFWVNFEILKQLLWAFVCVSSSFIGFDAYFKVLIGFLELQ